MNVRGLAGLALLVCLALGATGCCCYAPSSCADCTPHDILAAAPVPAACADGCCPPVIDPCPSCGLNGPCPKHYGSRGLLGYVRDALCCGSSCGELYLHPWINDPPDRCDPCDDYGNWIGPQPCGPAGCVGGCPTSWRNLWGHQLGGAAPWTGSEAMGPPPLHFEGEVIEGPAIYGPTPADREIMPPIEGQELESPEPPPVPPELPRPAAGSRAPQTRSALKKVDGRSAVYYNRAPQATLR